MSVLDILLVMPDGTERNVGKARVWGDERDRDDKGNATWDVDWYVKVFEGYVSEALGEYGTADMDSPKAPDTLLRFRGVGDRR